MGKVKLVSILVMTCVLVLPTMASADVPENAAEVVLDKIIENDIDGAVEDLFDEKRVKLLQAAKIEQMRTQIGSLFRIYGDADGYDLAKKEEISPRVVSLRYAVYHDKMPIIWEFIAYEDHGDWNIIFVNFTDEIQNFK